MKKLILTLSILTIALIGSAVVGPAFAQDQDSIGIYLSNGLHGAIEPLGSMLELHVVIKNMSAAEVSGVELKIQSEGPLTILGSTVAYPIQAINFANRPGEYIVGYSGPVPASSGSVEVMSFSALVTGVETAGLLYIRPVYYASVAGAPSYLVNNDNGELVELRQSTGGPDDAVFVVNDLPVATERTTFDSLKSMFR